MLITRLDVGAHRSWFFHHFSHVAEDYYEYGKNVYDVDKCIEYAKSYVSNTRNPKQKAKSEAMMKELLEYFTKVKHESTTVS